MKRVCIAVLAVVLLLAAVSNLSAQEEKPVIQQLLVNAEYWKREGQPDKAIEIYNKVLVSDPRNATALAELALIHSERGDTAQANAYLKRLENNHPRHPRIQEIRGALSQGPQFGQTVDEARDLVRRGQVEQGLGKYREAFDGKEPEGPVAMEYYQTMGGVEGRWEEARIGLEKLANQYPDNPRFQMALAKHLTYREATRREGIERLERISANPAQRKEADDARRQALLWLRAAPADQRLYQAYLERHPDDADVQRKVGEIRAQPVAPPWQADLEAAFEKLEAEELDEAEALFNRVLERNPRSIEARQGLAVIAMRRDDLPRAKLLLEEIREARPQTPDLWKPMLDTVDFWLTMRRGDTALLDGDDVTAEGYYREATGYAIEPVFHAHLALARIHESRGDFEKAEAEYLLVLDAQPEHRETLRALVALYLRMDRREQADAMNARLSALAPERAYSSASIRAETLRVAAAQRRRIGDAEGTLALLEEARRTDPSHIRALYDLAEVLLELRRFPESWLVLAELKQLLDELEDDSEMTRAELLEARLLMDDQRYEEAHDLVSRVAQRRSSSDVQRLKRVIEVSWRVHQAVQDYREVGRSKMAYDEMVRLQLSVTDSPELMAIVALGWQQMGETKRAMSLILTAHELTEHERPGVRLPYASVLLEQEEHERFEEIIEEIRLSPALSLRQRLDLANLRMAHAIRLSDKLRSARKYPAALDALSQVRRDYPGDSRIHSAIGRIYLSAERYPAAERAYRKALELAPADLEARRGLVEALRLQGKNQEARRVLKTGLELHAEDSRMHVQAGQVEASLGRDREAMGHFRRARELEQKQRQAAGEDESLSSDADAMEEDPIDAAILEIRGRHGSGIQPSLFARYRTGESGFGRLTHVYAPIKLHVATGYVGRFEFRATPVYVDAGRADLASPLVGQRYGSIGALGLNVEGGVHPSEGGVELEAGWRYQLFRLYIGSSPLGFPIMNILGGAEAGFSHRGFGLNLHLRRHTIKDSVLSYAGVRDPVTERHWGGVTGNGGRLDLTYATSEMLVYTFGGYDFIYGHDVSGNHNWFSGLGLRWTVHDDPQNTWRIGAALNALGYSDNRRYFTLGHGGYFSPQVFINGGIPVFWSGEIGPLRYEMNATVGANWFRESESDYYPKNADLQALRAALTDTLTGEPLQSRYPWRTSLSFAISGGASLAYELTEQFCVGMAVWGSLGHHYSEVYGGLMLGYSFTRGSRIVLPTSLEIAP